MEARVQKLYCFIKPDKTESKTSKNWNSLSMLGKYLTPAETLLDLGVFLSSKPTNHTHVGSFHLHVAPGTDKSSKACLWSKSFNCLINVPANYSTVSTLGEILLSPTKNALDYLKLC